MKLSGTAEAEAPLSLGQIIVANLHLQWFEAVALVQEVCAQAFSAALPSDTIPEPSSIFVSADGVTLVPGPVSGHPVRRLGLALGALLHAQGTPAELRLFVSRATSEPPLYQTVEEFSIALAYFERPDRAQIVRDVYEKVTHAPEAAAPPPVEAVKRQPERRGRLTLRQFLIVAGMLGVLAAVTIAAWSQSSAWAPPGFSFSGAFDTLKAAVGIGMERGLEAGRELLAKAGVVAPEPPVPSPAGEPATASRPPSRVARTPAALPPAAAPAGLSAAEIRRVEIAPPSPPRGLSFPGAEEPVDGPRPENPVVYSRSDAGVIPPVQFYPALPREPPPDVSPDAISVIEVVVDENGYVTAMKLLNPPGRFGDRMLLSAVKAWRFRPAMRDGRPVKFRHLIRLTH